MGAMSQVKRSVRVARHGARTGSVLTHAVQIRTWPLGQAAACTLIHDDTGMLLRVFARRSSVDAKIYLCVRVLRQARRATESNDISQSVKLAAFTLLYLWYRAA